MHRFYHRLENFAVLVKHLQWKEIGHKIGNRVYSNTSYYGVVKRLSDRPESVTASIPTELRLLRDEDVQILFDIHAPGLAHSDISDRLYAHLLLNVGIQTCYVAVTEDDQPCAALWLISAADNMKLRSISNGNFPLLADDEILLEGTFTLQPYRNRHIMAASIIQGLAKARESGAAKVIGFVHGENYASLRTLDHSGFTPYIVKKERWFFFIRTMTFEALSSSPAEVFNRAGADGRRIPKKGNAGGDRSESYTAIGITTGDPGQ